MSATAEDQELDSALEELLGEAFKDAENPAVGEEGVPSRGHIEGSHPFPKNLVEKVSFFLVIVLSEAGFATC